MASGDNARFYGTPLPSAAERFAADDLDCHAAAPKSILSYTIRNRKQFATLRWQQLSSKRKAQEFFAQAANEHVLACYEIGPDRRGPVQPFARRQHRDGVNRLAVFLSSPGANRAEILQGKPQRVHLGVTMGAACIFEMMLED